MLGHTQHQIHKCTAPTTLPVYTHVVLPLLQDTSAAHVVLCTCCTAVLDAAEARDNLQADIIRSSLR